MTFTASSDENDSELDQEDDKETNELESFNELEDAHTRKLLENNPDDSSNDDSNAETDNQECSTANEGWADSIAKILKTNKPKGKKTLVLSKAKKLTDIRREPGNKDVGYEVEGNDGEVRKEKVDHAEPVDNNLIRHIRKRVIPILIISKRDWLCLKWLILY